tara:strand:+ start:1205 stop:1738 length:534 start_codon:yes stop_codon:yes gene_type:complete
MNPINTVLNGIFVIFCAVIAGLMLGYLALSFGILTFPDLSANIAVKGQDLVRAIVIVMMILPVTVFIGFWSLKVLDAINCTNEPAPDPRAPFTNKLPKSEKKPLQPEAVAASYLTLLSLTMAASLGFGWLSEISSSAYLHIGYSYSLGDVFNTVSVGFYLFVLMEVAYVLAIPKWSR